MRASCYRAVYVAGLLLLLGGCVQEIKTPPRVAPPLGATHAKHNASAIELATNACAGHLQDIGLALQLYYHDYRGMPRKLEMAAALAKRRLGLNLVLSCPDSGPFVYVPAGLGVPGQSRRLVVYEPTSHNGWRWGLVMSPPPQGMTTVTAEVVHLSDDVFNAYLSAAKPGVVPPPQ